MPTDDRDPYSLLGVDRRASPADISRAYRRAARTTHPDTSPGDRLAAERFRALTTAYETLSDPGRRAAYDRAHPVATARARAKPVPLRARGLRLSVRIEVNGRRIGADDVLAVVRRRLRRR